MYSIVRARRLRSLRADRIKLRRALELLASAEADRSVTSGSLTHAETQCQKLLTELAKVHADHIEAERKWAGETKRLNAIIDKLTAGLEAAPQHHMSPALIADLTARYGEVVSVFHTLAGAPVIIHRAWFMTRFDYRGAPHAADEPHHIHGYQWRCLGCQMHGREDDWYNDPGFRTLTPARDDATIHARACASTACAPLVKDHLDDTSSC